MEECTDVWNIAHWKISNVWNVATNDKEVKGWFLYFSQSYVDKPQTEKTSYNQYYKFFFKLN